MDKNWSIYGMAPMLIHTKMSLVYAKIVVKKSLFQLFYYSIKLVQREFFESEMIPFSNFICKLLDQKFQLCHDIGQLQLTYPLHQEWQHVPKLFSLEEK